MPIEKKRTQTHLTTILLNQPTIVTTATTMKYTYVIITAHDVIRLECENELRNPMASVFCGNTWERTSILQPTQLTNHNNNHNDDINNTHGQMTDIGNKRRYDNPSPNIVRNSPQKQQQNVVMEASAIENRRKRIVSAPQPTEEQPPTKMQRLLPSTNNSNKKSDTSYTRHNDYQPSTSKFNGVLQFDEEEL